jgi:primosomal protein N' (replication factor Y)
MAYIQVALDVPLPTLFDYRADDARSADVGCRVRVPFGRKQAIGIVMGLETAPSIPAESVRAAGEVLRDMPPLPADILALLRFCSGYYHHPIGEVVAGALPARFRSVRPAMARSRSSVAATEAGRRALEGGLTRAPALARLLTRLCEARRLTADEIAALDANDRRALKAVLEKGWAERAPDDGSVAAGGTQGGDESVVRPPLNEEQRTAVDAIVSGLDRFQPWLLHGITGSGKTEVYLHAMEVALRAGRQILLLVPEIGLTPQLESRVRARFAQWRVVTMHSGLSDGERMQHWLAAHEGSARIVLGTRSAIFTPMPQLGLIVVDEEHDASYKQIEGMRYSARDLAVWRARQRGVPVVLGSATPSLESYHAALHGRYRKLTLERRANEAPLPSVRTVAMGERAEGLSQEVLEAVRTRLDRREQVLVFINRRGYAPVLVCTACAWAPGCHRCSARLVLHRPKARMVCHHCGHAEPIPAACASCGNMDLRPLGYGTQRIEAAVAEAFPDARILRVDRDTTRAKNAWNDMRSSVERGDVDILVGTQLLSKGHDFPGLGLVCVLNADQSLYSTDFRASEHLFAQLIQVAGRAGRGQVPGEVLIQTQFPTHPIFRAVQAHDYAGFARTLLAERKQARFPPFVYQAVLRAEATQMKHALDFLRQAAAIAETTMQHVEVFEPTPAVMERIKGRERAQLLVQADARSSLHAFLDRWCEKLVETRAYGARWAIDVDPIGL